jgi:hypothetical protein
VGIVAGSRTLKLSILADVDDLKKKLSTADNDVQGFTGQIEKFGKIAAAAFAAAAAAAAAYAVKIGIDGVKAAIEDEAAQKRLAMALENATGATNEQIKAVEDQILKYQLAYGVSDKDLRPALQRLALSTNDLTKAQDLLATALDVSIGTGKPLETVTNALAKAYDGSTTSLAKLGVGLSSAELKSMSFAQVQDQLNRTFGGAAQAQANTYQGQIARLTQTFEEAKESIGARLLPVLQQLFDTFLNKIVPAIAKFSSVFDPIKQAIDDNKEAFKSLGEFIMKYIVPVFVDGLGAAISFIAKVVAGVIDVIGSVINGIKTAVSFAIDGINMLIKAYNAVPLLPNIPLISKPSTSSAPVVSASVPTVKAPTINIPTVSTPAVATAPTATTAAAAAAVSNVVVPMGAVGRGEYGDTYNNYINVSGAIDPESTARQIIDVLNQSVSRGGAGSNTALMA